MHHYNQNQNGFKQSELNKLSGIILDSCITVHKEMGPGLLESVYELCLLKELELRGLSTKNQVKIPLLYKGHGLQKEFVIDILVEDKIIIEVKSVETSLPVFDSQLISYLKLTEKNLGILANFNVPLMKNGFKRLINNIEFN